MPRQIPIGRDEIIAQLFDEKRKIKDISAITNLTRYTIRRTLLRLGKTHLRSATK